MASLEDEDVEEGDGDSGSREREESERGMPTTSRQTTHRGRWRLQLGQAIPEEEVGLVVRILSGVVPEEEVVGFVEGFMLVEEGARGAGRGLLVLLLALLVMEEEEE